MSEYDNISKRSAQWKTWHDNGIGSKDAIIDTASQLNQLTYFSEYFTDRSTALDLLEIGPFNGVLCDLILSNYNINSYTLVDDTSRLEICKQNLSHYNKIKYVSIEDLKSISDGPFDAFISNNCLSETTNEYQNYIFNNFFVSCKQVFIIDNFNESSQFHMSAADYLKRLTKSLHMNFTDVKIIDITRDSKLFYATR